MATKRANVAQPALCWFFINLGKLWSWDMQTRQLVRTIAEEASYPTDDALGPARGIGLGVVLGAAMWASILALVLL